MTRIVLVVAILATALVAPVRADTLRIAAAGSLSGAFTDLLRRFPAAGPDSVAPAEFGPSGLLREKIEAGAPVDLFASADMEHARRLTIGHPERSVLNFTRNQLCALARQAAGLTPDTLLERMLDPGVRLATSTPGADPGGDYAWAVFARAEAVHPGARAVLEAKALPLVGGGAKTPLLVPGKGAVEGVFLADRADIMLGYCSSAREVAQSLPNLAVVTLPAELAVSPAYGMVVLNPTPVALRFAVFVMSETGQALLKARGFDPVALAGEVRPLQGLLVQRSGHPAMVLALERLAALPSVTQHVAVAANRGRPARDWSGPLLWDVLVAAGAVDPAKPGEPVRRIVRVTGSDGYAAVFALAELAPAYSARSILLAGTVDGQPVGGDGPTVIVPEEHRGGRAVHGVVRIDVE